MNSQPQKIYNISLSYHMSKRNLNNDRDEETDGDKWYMHVICALVSYRLR